MTDIVSACIHETFNEGRRLIFIGGSPRSGTTLVQNMLDSHPLILGGPEFLHLPDIIELRRKLHSSINREWISLICSRDDVDRHAVTIIKKLFLSLADKHQKLYYSEKTPENILVFPELMELFPDAHFIQVVRDPRAILLSMQQVKNRAIAKGMQPPSFTANTSASIGYIRKCFEAGMNAVRLSPDKVLTVVYEGLLSSPELEAKKICTHLGIDWDERMLRPGEKEHLGDQAITVKSNEIWYDAKSYNRNLYAPDADKWKNELSLWRQVRATAAFAHQKELSQCGYDFSSARLWRGEKLFLRVSICFMFIGIFLYRIASTIGKKLRIPFFY